MHRFKSILVGVDLSDQKHLVCDAPSSASQQAAVRAIELAKANSAALTFLYVLPSWSRDVESDSEWIDGKTSGGQTVTGRANEVLADLAARATGEGVTAEGKVVVGKTWVEIIRQVMRGEHDIVIAGSRHADTIRSMLLGSTAIKLLRKCPCPVWVTRPHVDPRIKSILIAHDLQPVGDLAMDVGCSIASHHGADLHVLHAEEYPEYDHMFPSRVSAKSAAQYRSRAMEHIQSQLRQHELSERANVHLETEAPDLAILHCIEKNSIELVVMGTVARVGIPGLITGNTAERLLPLLPCSVIAVKPEGFKSPVTLKA